VTERICITQLAGTMVAAVALGRGIMMVWKYRGVAFGVMLNKRSAWHRRKIECDAKDTALP
jgi:hypothetical protein